MKNYSFVKTAEEIAGTKKASSKWSMKKELTLNWLIDESTYRRLLPPGLEPTNPQCFAFISHFPYAAAGLAPYTEAALFVHCAYDGVPGVYCLSMPVDGRNEMGVFMGREIFSYPKKLGKVRFERRGDEVYASVTRNGVTFFEVTANIDGSMKSDIPLNVETCDYAYLLDYKLKSDGIDLPHMQALGYDHVRLHRQKNRHCYYSSEVCTAEFKFAASEDDPWIECKPVKMLPCYYNIFDAEMNGTQVVKEYTKDEIETIQPHLYARWDTSWFGKQHEFF